MASLLGAVRRVQTRSTTLLRHMNARSLNNRSSSGGNPVSPAPTSSRSAKRRAEPSTHGNTFRRGPRRKRRIEAQLHVGACPIAVMQRCQDEIRNDVVIGFGIANINFQ